MDIGPEYASTMGLRLIEGRLFDKSGNRQILQIIHYYKSENGSGFWWKEPLGMTVTMYDTTKFTVVGVVKDFYINGVWQKILQQC